MLIMFFSILTVLFCYILVYGTLRNPKLLRRLPHRGAIFYYVIPNFNGALLDICFQKFSPLNTVVSLYAGGNWNMLDDKTSTFIYRKPIKVIV